MAKSRAAVQVNIVGRDGSVGPPVFLTNAHLGSTASSLQHSKEGSSIGSVSITRLTSLRL